MENLHQHSTNLLQTELILAQAKIKESQKVANLGCGASGFLVFAVAKILGKAGMLYAVDILPTVLERISKQAKVENILNIKTIWSNLEIFNATKIPSASLDCALLINVLHQSSAKATDILRETARMLQHNGRAVVVDWLQTAAPLGPQAEHKISAETVISLAKKNGMILDKEFKAGKYHYGLVFNKI